ncbi:MAG: hypothetical protein N2036_13285 [Bryobacteraceae bacterium]|nr:hypothetical protein [Bryobacteraceae bacterium]MCX7605044.1 hypothetical protein [Bryobacteraceae bacterium]
MTPASRKSAAISRRSLLAAIAAAALPLRAAAVRERVQWCGIPFWRLANGDSRLRLLRIHGDEETARQAVELLLDSVEGEAWIVDSRTRLVEFRGFQIDPNRMFSRAGAERNLWRLNPEAAPGGIAAALDALDSCRDAMLRALMPPPGGLWIAAHNNGPGYSMETEAPISRKIHRPQPDMPRDFFLFTEEKDYQIAEKGPYNAVLQDRPGGEDDGSLSRWCAAAGIRYVNVEAAHGKLDKQLDMIRWLVRSLPL